VDALRDSGDVVLRGRRGLVQVHALAVLLEDAVDGQQVEVYVKVEAPTKSLGEGDGARLRAGDGGQALGGA
jgi:hypothetical protein